MYTKSVLQNGITLVTEQLPHFRSDTLGVWVRSGSRDEPAEYAGISHFIEHLFFKGTESRSAAEIAHEIDAMGGVMDAFTSREFTGFFIRTQSAGLSKAVELLADILLNPRFDAVDVEREKGVVLEEISMVEDTPDDLVHELFARHAWAGSPLSRSILGTTETVSRIVRDDVQRVYSDRYVPPLVVIACAGGSSHSEVRREIERSFGSLQGEVPPEPNGVRPKLKCGHWVHPRDQEQVHLVMGFSGIPQTHPDRHSLFVLNDLLGGSMSSRLFQKIREERGLTYSIGTYRSAYRDAGQLCAYAACRPENALLVLQLMAAEFASLAVQPVTSAELERAKSHLKGVYVLSQESSSARMSVMARHEIFFGQHYPIDAVLSAIDEVGAGDVLDVAARMFKPGSEALVALGPLDKDLPAFWPDGS